MLCRILHVYFYCFTVSVLVLATFWPLHHLCQAACKLGLLPDQLIN